MADSIGEASWPRTTGIVDDGQCRLRLRALAQILGTCPGIKPTSSIALLSPRTSDPRTVLATHGFWRVTSTTYGDLQRSAERYDCVGVLDDGAPFDGAALAAFRRRLTSAGSVVLDISHSEGPHRLAARLKAAHFWMLQYRVIGLPQPDGSSDRAVFLIARAPRSPLREIPGGRLLAKLGVRGPARPAA